VNNKQRPSSHSFPKGFQLLPQPAQAWTAILGLAFLSGLCILAGAGKILNLAFPVGAFAVGVFLYVRYPILYNGFTWWIWFLTPIIRRLSDYRSGFTNPSAILLTPYLVTLVTLATLYQNFPKSHRQGGLPFILSFASLFYGFLIGLINRQPITVCINLLEWLAPVLLGFHLFVNWRDYPNYRQNIERVFVWGVLLMGVYGVIQYLVAPEWDRFWLSNAEINSAGIPEPLGIRVWSTMNSPGPFAIVIMAGLLLLFGSQGALCLPAAVAGYLAFLLTLVRSAWGGWFLGLLTLATSLKANFQIRLLITVVVIALCVIPLTVIEPFSEVINTRLETLSDIENDGSTLARQQTYEQLLGLALTSFIGEGIGGETYDSSALAMLFNIGWLGTIFYMGGMLLLLFCLFQGSESRFDRFAGSTRAIVLAIFAQLPLGAPMLGVSGIMLWGFLGIGLAARKYYQHQKQIGNIQGSVYSTPP